MRRQFDKYIFLNCGLNCRVIDYDSALYSFSSDINIGTRHILLLRSAVQLKHFIWLVKYVVICCLSIVIMYQIIHFYILLGNYAVQEKSHPQVPKTLALNNGFTL